MRERVCAVRPPPVAKLYFIGKPFSILTPRTFVDIDYAKIAGYCAETAPTMSPVES